MRQTVKLQDAKVVGVPSPNAPECPTRLFEFVWQDNAPLFALFE